MFARTAHGGLPLRRCTYFISGHGADCGAGEMATPSGPSLPPSPPLVPPDPPGPPSAAPPPPGYAYQFGVSCADSVFGLTYETLAEAKNACSVDSQAAKVPFAPAPTSVPGRAGPKRNARPRNRSNASQVKCSKIGMFPFSIDNTIRYAYRMICAGCTDYRTVCRESTSKLYCTCGGEQREPANNNGAHKPNKNNASQIAATR